MRIAIVSDSHGDQRMVAQALKILAPLAVDCILHCGDIGDADTILFFTGTPTHYVLGNCDVDSVALAAAARISGGTLHGRFADLELSGRRIAIIHGDNAQRMREAEGSGRYDYLFYGHTHQAEEHRTGRTFVLNPGALHRAQPKTMAVLDLPIGTVRWIRVDE